MVPLAISTRNGIDPHPLFGVKFLAALGVFFIASALTGRTAALAGMRRNANSWMVAVTDRAVQKDGELFGRMAYSDRGTPAPSHAFLRPLRS